MNVNDREQVTRRALTVALRTAAGIVGNRDQAADIGLPVATEQERTPSRPQSGG